MLRAETGQGFVAPVTDDRRKRLPIDRIALVDMSQRAVDVDADALKAPRMQIGDPLF